MINTISTVNMPHEEWLKQSCHRCDLRWRNISTTVDTLEAEKEAGFDKIDIDRALSMIKSLY